MMPLASLRIEKELLDEARALGLNVSEAAREGIRNAIRRKRMLENIDWLERHATPASEPSEDLVRRVREERSEYLARRHGSKGNHG